MSVLAPFTIYTTLHPEKLKKMAASARSSIRRETKRWVDAKKRYDLARSKGERVRIVFSDAAQDCSRLLYSAEVESLKLDETGTTYSVTDFKPIRRRRTQELVLISTGNTIAEGFIRPYAVVETPAFLTSSRIEPRTSEPLTVFSFGYWGTGRVTQDLVKAFDGVERARGFKPPFWVDIRIRRAARAAGFRADAFEKLLGARYLWMPELGNLSVVDKGSGIRIQSPKAAADLLGMALKDRGRRVIFFCACETPSGCHRHTVAKLVSREAARAKVEAEIVEWPGGKPIDVNFEGDEALMKALKNGGSRLPIPKSMSKDEAFALPWYSRLEASLGTEFESALVGPATFASRGAYLRAFWDNAGLSEKAIAARKKSSRAKGGYDPV